MINFCNFTFDKSHFNRFYLTTSSQEYVQSNLKERMTGTGSLYVHTVTYVHM